MYGLVHIGMRDLITSAHGKNRWGEVLNRSGLNEDAFVAMQSYPDNTSYQLVGAAVEVLETPVTQILEAFGRHWVLSTGPEAYGNILDMSGESLPELLENLDDLHVHVANIMPNLKAPSFQCKDVTEHSLTLHYHSSRQGLTAMVIGLLAGAGERFHTPCEVEIVSSVENDNGADVIFSVTW